MNDELNIFVLCFITFIYDLGLLYTTFHA